ncbi:MAG: hypothetical protein ACK4OO_07355, partial [bacterium]
EAMGEYHKALEWYTMRLANLESSDDRVALAARDRIARIKSFLNSHKNESPSEKQDIPSRDIKWGFEAEIGG